MNLFVQCLIVGGAGFVGAITRFLLAILFVRLPVAFPFGTLFINVTGSFALGLLLARSTLTVEQRLAIGVGFLGAYTTFSTFSVESDALIRDGMTVRAVAYVVASVVLGIAAARVGYMLAR